MYISATDCNHILYSELLSVVVVKPLLVSAKHWLLYGLAYIVSCWIKNLPSAEKIDNQLSVHY